MLLASSGTKRTLMRLFLFTNSTQRELVSICMQSIRNCNYLSLHYNLALMHLFLLTNSAQRELVSICTQSIRSRYKRTQLTFLALVPWHGRSKRIRFSWNFEIHDFFLNTRTFFTIIQKEIEEGRPSSKLIVNMFSLCTL